MSRVKIMGACRIRENIGEHSGTPRWSLLTTPEIERGKITNDLKVVIGSKEICVCVCIYIYIYLYLYLYIFHETSDMRKKKQTPCK